MIRFEEELKKFKPSLEVDATDESIRNTKENDMVDLMLEIMSEYHEG